MNLLRKLWDTLTHTGPVKSDYRITYQGGPVIESVERGSTTRWYIDGARVPKEEAQARMRAEEESRQRRP